MIAGGTKKNSLIAHYEWLAIGVAALALVGAGVFALGAFGTNPEECAEDAVSAYRRTVKEGETGVKPVDLKEYERASALLDSKKVPRLADVAETGSFLASGGRVFCEHADCRRPMPVGVKVCPFCKKEPVVKEAPVAVADTDGDGMTDEWEKKYGLDPNDPADAAQDKDGDEFTNLEEFLAKTDPTMKSEHPDYFESLSVRLPLVETKLPFFFEKVMKLPAGYRFYFRDPNAKNDYGKRGVQYTPLAGEEIGKTGFTVVSYEEKSEKRKIKSVGSEKALEKTVDVSTATIERKSDKRRFALLVGNNKLISVDVQAQLFYNRGAASKEFKVVAGDTIEFGGTKYVVKSIESVGKGAKISLADSILGKIRVVEALEQ